MTISFQNVQAAWNRLYGTPDKNNRPGADGYAVQGLQITGVPGMAIAVVFQNEPLYAYCGARDLALGEQALIDAKTVFPIASLSKPITSTIMASLVTQNLNGNWYTPIRDIDPSYHANEKVTVASLLAHRSGLIDHAGDSLEDLGFVRNYIMRHITDLATWPATSNNPYACAYQYTNFGYSEAAFALAKKMNTQWEDLAEKFFKLYDMNRTSYRYADFLTRDNAVKSYQRNPVPRADRDPLPPNPSWSEPAQPRNPDAQSPAGGVTSSLFDLIEWMWLNIQAQRAATHPVEMKAHETKAFYDNIRQTHVAYPNANDPEHYGFGWNTKIDPHMGLNLSHSGAFELGAATCVSLLPGENIGIIALTNGQPIGLPEAICRQFLYDVTNHPDRMSFADTLKGAADFMQRALYPVPSPDFSLSPTKPVTPIANPRQFVGRYFNDYYQNVTISGAGSAKDPFAMQAGASGERFVLTAYEGLTFTFQTTGENADGLSGVTFVPNGSGGVSELRVNHFTMPARDSQDRLVLKPGVFKILSRDGGIRGVLLVGKFRTQQELNGMSLGDRRNTLITELAGRTKDPVGHYQSLNDGDLAGAGALLVYLRDIGSRTDQQIKTMSDDDMRNTVIVEVGAQTGRGRDLQALSNKDLIQLVLGQPSYIRGVLLVGKFRTQKELNGMSPGDQRNTLITELAGRTKDAVGHYQSLNDGDLVGAGALLVYLRGTGSRTDQQIKTMSDDDMRNTVIVEVGAETTNCGGNLQALSNLELARLVLDPPTDCLH